MNAEGRITSIRVLEAKVGVSGFRATRPNHLPTRPQRPPSIRPMHPFRPKRQHPKCRPRTRQRCLMRQSTPMHHRPRCRRVPCPLRRSFSTTHQEKKARGENSQVKLAPHLLPIALPMVPSATLAFLCFTSAYIACVQSVQRMLLFRLPISLSRVVLEPVKSPVRESTERGV